MLISFATKNNFATFLEQISQNQRKSESARQILAQIQQFDPVSVFYWIDVEKKGYILPVNLLQFLQRNKIILTNDEIYILFKKFDPHKEGRINISSFSENLLPKQHRNLSTLVSNRTPLTLKPGDKLPQSVELALIKYLTQQIENHQILQKIRITIFSQYDFSIQLGFNLLDFHNKGYINLNDIDQYLKANSRYLTNAETNQIFRVIDKKKDNIIDIDQFAQILNPFEDGFYPNYNINQPVVQQIRTSRRRIQLEEALIQENLKLERQKQRFIQSSIQKEQLLKRSLKNSIMRQQLIKQQDLDRTIQRSRSIEREKIKAHQRLALIQNILYKDQAEKVAKLQENLKRSRIEQDIKRQQIQKQKIKQDLYRSRRLSQLKSKRSQLQQIKNKLDSQRRLQKQQQQNQMQHKIKEGIQILNKQSIENKDIENKIEFFEAKRALAYQQISRSKRQSEVRRSRLNQNIKQKIDFHRIAQQELRQNNRLLELQKSAEQNQYRRSRIETELKKSRLYNNIKQQQFRSIEKLRNTENLIEQESANRLRKLLYEQKMLEKDLKYSTPFTKLYESPKKAINIDKEIRKSHLESQLEQIRLVN